MAADISLIEMEVGLVMTEKTIEKALLHYRQYEIEMKIIKDCSDLLNFQELENNTRYRKLRQRKSLIDHWMSLLTEEERMIVHYHFFNGMCWSDMLNLDLACGGKNISSDRRTLQRTKKRSIEKIQYFMNDRFGQSLNHIMFDDD